MRTRVRTVRQALLEGVRRFDVPRDFSYITRQSGLFSPMFTRPGARDALVDSHALYIGSTGSINVTALPTDGIERFWTALRPWITPDSD